MQHAKIDGQQNQKDVDSKKEQRRNARNKQQCNRKEEKNPKTMLIIFKLKKNTLSIKE